MPDTGPGVLGFGKNAENAAMIQANLREAGYQATNFALTDDEAGDEHSPGTKVALVRGPDDALVAIGRVAG